MVSDSNIFKHWELSLIISVKNAVFTVVSSPSVPPPSLTITGSPVDEGFHTGLLLTLTGRAEFNPAVNIPITMVGSWTKDNSSDITSDGRVSVEGPVLVQSSPKVYETTLTVDVLDRARGDSGNYSIRLDIMTSEPFTTGITTTLTRSITVSGNEVLLHMYCV